MDDNVALSGRVAPLPPELQELAFDVINPGLKCLHPSSAGCVHCSYRATRDKKRAGSPLSLSAAVAAFSWITLLSGHPEDARMEKVKQILKVLSPDTHKRKTTLL